ncbi:hypothetical protein BDEG_25160 [Batrachochytrium dendrobatidis JEL423]|uniref:Uncharacterized protein n=1 Tax=Batrachochytrium dendrobatidis (strain JEL423) TaxID=403673 RepID=A0A177WP62_BATDL|nr:hypothetical protein BDEG_25160 [Batrachochytrium dendrobatidis JEL423]
MQTDLGPAEEEAGGKDCVSRQTDEELRSSSEEQPVTIVTSAVVLWDSSSVLGTSSWRQLFSAIRKLGACCFCLSLQSLGWNGSSEALTQVGCSNLPSLHF